MLIWIQGKRSNTHNYSASTQLWGGGGGGEQMNNDVNMVKNQKERRGGGGGGGGGMSVMMTAVRGPVLDRRFSGMWSLTCWWRRRPRSRSRKWTPARCSWRRSSCRIRVLRGPSPATRSRSFHLGMGQGRHTHTHTHTHTQTHTYTHTQVESFSFPKKEKERSFDYTRNKGCLSGPPEYLAEKSNQSK